MKVFSVTLLILIAAFVGIRMTQTPTVKTVGAIQHENMKQFSDDLAVYMTDKVAKKDPKFAATLTIKADCKPNQGVYHTRCWIHFTTPNGVDDNATSENVRRTSTGFTWDRES